MGIAALALLVSGLAPAAGGAVTLGSDHIEEGAVDFGAACSEPPCNWVQTKLPGAQVRSPFTGKIRKWRIVTVGSTDLQLGVFRKRGKGKLELVRASVTESSPVADEYIFETSLGIRKGDYIGLIASQAAGRDNPDAAASVFDPGLALGDPGKRSFRSHDEYLFNATVKR